jgi:hypothetical protein
MNDLQEDSRIPHPLSLFLVECGASANGDWHYSLPERQAANSTGSMPNLALPFRVED